MTKRDYDAIIVGSGPNGLAAAITLQHAGLSVLVIEGSSTVGGGLRSKELTLPGFVHDVCSAIHPMAATSPLFNSLPLHQHGLEYLYPAHAAAHPFDDGTAAVLHQSIEATAESLGVDGNAYKNLFEPLAKIWPGISRDVLGPLHFPKHPVSLAQFGLKAMQSAEQLVKRFSTQQARGLWAGMSGHSMLPFNKISTGAIGLVLSIAGHLYGWPLPKGGSQKIADALVSYFQSLGGSIQTNFYVKDLHQLPSAHTILFDVSPRQLLTIAGHRFSDLYKNQLNRYRYGMGVFKIDWAIDGPIPFKAEECLGAGTIHLGNTFEEIASSELATWKGQHADKPYVLLAQQSLFDDTRAPVGNHTAWAYCHVPNGSTLDRTDAIENQIERFAPGFRDRILAKHVMNTEQMEAYNPNYIGGDINGGAIDIGQLFTRPVLRASPYRTSAKGLYICSASTPPGGGVHGMCGYYAARRALKDIFKLETAIIQPSSPI